MADKIVAPYDDAEDLLNSADIDFDAMYRVNADGEVKVNSKATVAASLSAVMGLDLPFAGEIAAIAYSAIKQSSATKVSDKRDTEENVEAAKAAATQSVAGTVASATMESMNDQLPPDTMIEWRPSSAFTPDVEHQRYYGQTMTFERAYQLGLGRRYGCKCSMKVLDAPDDLQTVK